MVSKSDISWVNRHRFLDDETAVGWPGRRAGAMEGLSAVWVLDLQHDVAEKRLGGSAIRWPAQDKHVRARLDQIRIEGKFHPVAVRGSSLEQPPIAGYCHGRDARRRLDP